MNQQQPWSQSPQWPNSQASNGSSGTSGQAANFLEDALFTSPPPAYASPPPSYNSSVTTRRANAGEAYSVRGNPEPINAASPRLYNEALVVGPSSSRAFALPHRSQSTQGPSSNSAQPAAGPSSFSFFPPQPRRPSGDLSTFTIADIVAYPCDFSNIPLFEPSQVISPPANSGRPIRPLPGRSSQDPQRRRQQRVPAQSSSSPSSSQRIPTDEELLRAPKMKTKDLPYVGDSPGEIPSPPETPPRRESLPLNPYPTPALSDEDDVSSDNLGLFVASLRNRRFATRR